MSEKFNEWGGFDSILAEEFSLYMHELWEDCPHDIGIKLARIAEEVYAEANH